MFLIFHLMNKPYFKDVIYLSRDNYINIKNKQYSNLLSDSASQIRIYFNLCIQRKFGTLFCNDEKG